MRALLLPLVCAACAFDTSVPIDADIACKNENDCPAGYVCKESIGRCSDLEDQEPPSVVDATITPQTASFGDVIEVSLTASEPLADAPEVWLSIDAARVAVPLDRVDSLTSVHRLTLDGTLPFGTAAITADLIDQSGNIARGIGLGSVTLE
jgi:hypothetical protein